MLGGNGGSYYLQQYVYSASSTLDFELDITASIPSTPIGIIGYLYKIHVMSTNSKLYRIDLSSPYTITEIQTTPRGYENTSQSPGSVTTAFIS